MSNKKGFSFLNVEKVFSAESKKINKKAIYKVEELYVS
jgi:hypothetical protein